MLQLQDDFICKNKLKKKKEEEEINKISIGNYFII